MPLSARCSWRGVHGGVKPRKKEVMINEAPEKVGSEQGSVGP